MAFKITEADFEKVYGKKQTQPQAKPATPAATQNTSSFTITEDDFDKVFGASRQKEQETQLFKPAQTAGEKSSAVSYADKVKQEKGWLDTLGAFGQSLMEGIRGGVENMGSAADYGSIAVNQEADLAKRLQGIDITNPQAISDAMKTNYQQAGIESEYAKRIGREIAQRQQAQGERIADIQQKYEGTPLVDIAVNAGQGVGNMIPAIAIGGVSAPALGTAAFATNVFGSSAGEALNNGASLSQAGQYATASAALETAVESVFGGIPNIGDGILNPETYVKKFTKSAMGRLLANRVADIMGEGVEEAVSEVIQPFLVRAFYDKNADDASIWDALYAAGNGALVSAILGIANVPGTVGEYRQNKADIAQENAVKDKATELKMDEKSTKKLTESFGEQTAGAFVQNNIDADFSMENGRYVMHKDGQTVPVTKEMFDYSQRLKADNIVQQRAIAQQQAVMPVYNADGQLEQGTLYGSFETDSEEIRLKNKEYYVKDTEFLREFIGRDKDADVSEINMMDDLHEVVNYSPEYESIKKEFSTEDMKLLKETDADLYEELMDVGNYTPESYDAQINYWNKLGENFKSNEYRKYIDEAIENRKENQAVSIKAAERIEKAKSSTEYDFAQQIAKDINVPGKAGSDINVGNIATIEESSDVDVRKKAAQVAEKTQNKARKQLLRKKLIDNGKGNIVKQLEAFEKRTGIKVWFYNGELEDVGGFTFNGEMFLDISDPNILLTTAIHESIHLYKNSNIDKFNKLRSRIFKLEADKKSEYGEIGFWTRDAYAEIYGDDTDAINEEVVAKLCEVCVNNPEQFFDVLGKEKTIIETILDILREIKNNIAIKLTNSEQAKIDNALIALERYLRSDAGVSESTRFSKKYSENIADSDGNYLSDEQMEFFAESKVRNDSGDLMVLYHGTTWDFTVFDRDKANPESDMGAGFYLSNMYDDSEGNYSGVEGPDLKNRIDRLTDEIEDREEIDRKEAYEKAMAELYGGEDQVMTVYRNIKNPVIIDEYNGTYLEAYSEYDEEYDEYGEPEGELVAYIQNAVYILYDYDVWDADRTAEEIQSIMWDYPDGIDAGQLVKEMKNKMIDTSDDNGNLIGNEIIREAFERTGYDGIMDRTVANKFKGMHLDPNTVHVIAFNSNQIKNVDNKQPTSNPDIRFSKKLVKKGYDIEKINEEAYNNRRWVVENKGLLTKAEYNRYLKLTTGRITGDENWMITNTTTGDNLVRVGGWIIQSNGDFANAPIKALYKLEGEFRKEIWDDLYEASKQNRPVDKETLDFYARKGFAAKFTSADYPDYHTLKGRKPDNGKNHKNSGKSNNRKGNLAENSEAVKASRKIKRAPIPEEYQGMSTQEITKALIKKHGTHNAGENPARDISVPKKDMYGRNVSKGVRTIMEAEVTAEEMLEHYNEAVAAGDFSYDVVRDKDAVNKAVEYINKYGFKDTYNEWRKKIDNKKEITKDDMVQAQIMYASAVATGDYDTAMELATDISIEATRAGQVVQSMRVLKKTTPESRLYYAQRSVKAIQEEVNEKYGDKAPTLKVADELLDNLKNAKTDEDIAKATAEINQAIAEQLPFSWPNFINSWRYLAMLGNTRTQIRNIASNIIGSVAQEYTNFVQTGIEKALSSRNIEKTSAVRTTEWQRKQAEADYKVVRETLHGDGKYSNDTLQGIQKLQNPFDFKGKGGKAGKVVSNALTKWNDVTNWAMDEGDKLFSRPVYIRYYARYLAANNITSEKQLTSKMKFQARAWATKQAKEVVYREGNALAKWIGNMEKSLAQSNKATVRTGAKIVGGIMPFRGTPLNITKRAFEYTPVGIAVELINNKNSNPVETINKAAKSLSGTSLIVLGYALAKSGLLTGGLGDDKEDKMKKQMGQQPYSVDVGNYSYTLDWGGAGIMPLFIGAEMYNSTSEDSENFFMALLDTFANASAPVMETSMMTGLMDALQTASYEDNMAESITSFLASGLSSYIGQFVPTILGQVARAVDDTSRTSYTPVKGVMKPLAKTVQKAENKIPFLSKTNVPYMDVWGNEEKNVGGNTLGRLAYNMLSPGYAEKKSTDKVEKMLTDLYDKTGDTSVLPSNYTTYKRMGDETIRFTDKQYEAYTKAYGQTAYGILNDLQSDKGFKSMEDAYRAELISKVYSYSTAIASNDVVDKELTARQANQQKAMEHGLSAYEVFGGLIEADGMGSEGNANGTLSKSEVMAYIESRGGLSKTEKAYLFAALGNSNWKNPYV
ncbi:MAG: hypothetical protein IKK99_00275 [Oscillospiraceae bacterium]|nr:hypothetical protein [Oscillospiraceae bacterium]